MSFPRYERYRDSGVEWLGEIPEHWEITKVKRVATKIGSGKTPRGGSEVYVSDGVTFLRSQNVHDSGLRLDDVVYISLDIDEEMDNTRVQSGDILLNVTGASIGRTTLVPSSLGAANVSSTSVSFGFPTFMLGTSSRLLYRGMSSKVRSNLHKMEPHEKG